MAKIIHLFEKRSDIIQSLEEILEMAKKGEFDNFMFATKSKDDTVITSWLNLDLVERQELIAHMQIEVNMGLIEEVLSDG